MHIISDAMAARDVPAYRVAEAAGISASHFSRLLAGEKGVRLAELVGICEALGLHLPTLLASAEARVREGAERDPKGRGDRV